MQAGKLTCRSEDVFCCQAIRYSSLALDSANHTDELVSDGNPHLRIDYKISGIGSGSCGPVIAEQFRLSERAFTFRFTLSK